MSLNWMRHFELQLVGADGVGLNLGDFRVSFTIESFNISSASSYGNFKIYNLNQQTINQITQNQFTRIQVFAGYEGLEPVVSEDQVGKARPAGTQPAGQRDGRNYSMIFSGDIRYTLTGKDNPVDSYILIQAGDTDIAFSTTGSASTLAAGWTADSMLSAMMLDFNAMGVTEGRRPEKEKMPPTVFPRGRVLFGMSRNLMDEVGEMCQAYWKLVNGKMEMVGYDEVMHEAVDLNSQTGLIGVPQQTFGNGVNVRCLINPNIRIHGQVRLNERDVTINRVSLPDSELSMATGRYQDDTLNGNQSLYLPGSKQQSASIATDGVYVVTGIIYTGDTRGQAWYMDIACEARGANDLPSKAYFDRTGGQ
ncbi:bacteriophage protein [Serratia marcescens]|uniref:hypothetical protein n=1 Tax=Serratia marcescens TaxID=615 RepID=UPI00062C91FB|nr:hypothetical protein [Serratia marcescens]KKZ19031.1 bacteriophage protein [Serratia marcescens]